MNVIGIGQIGRDIVSNLSEYGVYDVFSIVSAEDASENGSELIVPAPKHAAVKPAHESYDEWATNNSKKFKFPKEKTFVFVSGKSDISGILLGLLGTIKEGLGKEISVIYVRPELSFLSNLEKLQDNVVFGIAQELARSALLEELILFDVLSIEDFLGDLSIKDYYSQINKTIADYFHQWMYCENNSPIRGDFPDTTPHSRIGTLGSVDNEGNEFTLFPLKMNDDVIPYPTDIRYYFMQGTTALGTDRTLLKKIKNNISTQSKIYKTIGYGIYEVDDGCESTLTYTKTSKIQHNGET